ncbi:hypothetical protein AAC387_Pa10g1084 [Persea americana]
MSLKKLCNNLNLAAEVGEDWILSASLFCPSRIGLFIAKRTAPQPFHHELLLNFLGALRSPLCRATEEESVYFLFHGTGFPTTPARKFGSYLSRKTHAKRHFLISFPHCTKL